MSVNSNILKTLDGGFLDKLNIVGNYVTPDGRSIPDSEPCYFQIQANGRKYLITDIYCFMFTFDPPLSILPSGLIYDMNTLGTITMDQEGTRFKMRLKLENSPSLMPEIDAFGFHPKIEIDFSISESSEFYQDDDDFESICCIKSRLINYNFCDNPNTPFLHCPLYSAPYFEGFFDKNVLSSDLDAPSRELILVCSSVEDFDAMTERYLRPDEILDFTKMSMEWGGFWLKDDCDDRFNNEDSIYYNRFVGTWWDLHFWGGTDVHAFNLDLIAEVREY